MKVNTDPKIIDEVLSRGVEDVIVKEDLRKEMLSGRQLKIYLGTDPTGGDLHIGHAVIHKKLKDFQDLGHKVTLLVGDFTVLVGDHSDKDDQRIEVSRKIIEDNMKTYKEQFAKSVDISQVDLRYNSEWLSPLNFNDVIELAKVFTLQQMSERDAFQKRVKEGKPVGFDELLYPLMQGYDAYALKTDIQIGATDQTFNMQAGRKVMEHFNIKPQNIVAMRFLVGSDGRKMGKSLKNYIPIFSSAFEKFSGIMAIVDEIIIDYFTLLTRVPLSEIAEMKSSLEAKSVNPRDLKLKLAFEVAKSFHGEKEATSAMQEFKNVVQDKGLPDEIQETDLNGEMSPVDFLVDSGLVSSKSEAKRLIEQGGVELNGTKLDNTEKVNFKSGDVIRSGKKGFIKIK